MGWGLRWDGHPSLRIDFSSYLGGVVACVGGSRVLSWAVLPCAHFVVRSCGMSVSRRARGASCAQRAGPKRGAVGRRCGSALRSSPSHVAGRDPRARCNTVQI
eukprot:6257802-Prymnesium_polylepis.1